MTLNFIHRPYQPGDTIAAITTPPGEGGVAVIRISGDNAVPIADAVFSGDVSTYDTHTVHYGIIRDRASVRIDDVLLILMRGPRSYTGEDTVEISCHGGSLISRRVLEAILAAGARPAQPGEFTFKAYMNGKIDLAQAEAVQDLIAAKNEYAVNAAENQLEGALSRKVGTFQKRLNEIAAILEAWVDFPEEGLEFATNEQLCDDLDAVLVSIQKLVNSFHDGRIAHDGLSLCLAGSPNVGKSSLMNAMLDHDRAIVSHIPGTTRDIVEGDISIAGLNIRLVDTAGIRESNEVIEQEGIRRSRKAIADADLILCVLDADRGVSDEEHKLMSELPAEKTVVAWNKTDINDGPVPSLALPHVVPVSAKNRQGIEALQNKIRDVIWDKGPPSKEEIVITSVRHHTALKQAAISATKVVSGLQNGTSPEFLTMDMRDCLTELGRIQGTNLTEDVLSAIFSKFCIGK